MTGNQPCPHRIEVGMTLVRKLAPLVAAVSVVGCASGSTPDTRPQTVPPAFAAACGHPGAEVTVLQVPVTIPHRECDLRGVVVEYGLVGATVPDRFAETVAAAAVVGSDTTPFPPLQMQVSVDDRGDVTITGG